MTNFDVLSRRSLLTGAAAAAGLASLPAFAKAPMKNTAAPAYYRFKVGAFEVTVVSDGPLNLGPPSGDVFKGVSKEEMTEVLNNNFQPTDSVKLEQNAVVINTGPHLVLIDAGTGRP